MKLNQYSRRRGLSDAAGRCHPEPAVEDLIKKNLWVQLRVRIARFNSFRSAGNGIDITLHRGGRSSDQIHNVKFISLTFWQSPLPGLISRPSLERTPGTECSDRAFFARGRGLDFREGATSNSIRRVSWRDAGERQEPPIQVKSVSHVFGYSKYLKFFVKSLDLLCVSRVLFVVSCSYSSPRGTLHCRTQTAGTSKQWVDVAWRHPGIRLHGPLPHSLAQSGVERYVLSPGTTGFNTEGVVGGWRVEGEQNLAAGPPTAGGR